MCTNQNICTVLDVLGVNLCKSVEHQLAVTIFLVQTLHHITKTPQSITEITMATPAHGFFRNELTGDMTAWVHETQKLDVNANAMAPRGIPWKANAGNT